MTGATTMIQFTSEAEERLAGYLDDVRKAAAELVDVDPDEVAADVHEHVEMALHDAIEPISLLTLEKVLAQLGPPEGWTRDGERKWLPIRLWQRLGALVTKVRIWGERRYEKTMRSDYAAFDKLSRVLRFGPEEYRLAYFTFALFTLGVIVWPLLIPAYFLGRAALAASHGRDLGVRRWLIYPPVVLFSGLLLLAILVVPILAAAIATGSYTFEAIEIFKRGNAEDAEFAEHLLQGIPSPLAAKPLVAALFAGFAALGVWYTLLGIVARQFPRTVQLMFVPFLDELDRPAFRTIAKVGLIALLASAFFAYRYWQASGLT